MKKKKMKKGMFSRIILTYCIAFCSLIAFWSMLIAHTRGLLVTGVAGAIFAVFGGKLLLLCVKRIPTGGDDKGV